MQIFPWRFELLAVTLVLSTSCLKTYGGVGERSSILDSIVMEARYISTQLYVQLLRSLLHKSRPLIHTDFRYNMHRTFISTCVCNQWSTSRSSSSRRGHPGTSMLTWEKFGHSARNGLSNTTEPSPSHVARTVVSSSKPRGPSCNKLEKKISQGVLRRSPLI